MDVQSAIEADGVCYSFGGSWGLNKLTFAVASGQVFGLLGTNGAGKTTTIRLLTGQLRPQSGSIKVLGLDPLAQSQQLRRAVGVMSEDPGHYMRLSVRKNLCFFASLYGADPAYADELLEKVDLQSKADSAVSQLSRGMRQRLALARAMIGRPRLLFLDEPTSGLDPVAARGVRQLIEAYCSEGGTVFLTTHYMEEAERLCHQIAILHDGSLLCQGHYLDLCGQYLPEQIEIEQGGRKIKRSPGLEELFYHLTGRSIN
ncbi:ABC transporter ATP-binding protein [bacterium]|nr:ABC transporter ATP-binding protein [bacterium]